jgi:hypothetical protein
MFAAVEVIAMVSLWNRTAHTESFGLRTHQRHEGVCERFESDQREFVREKQSLDLLDLALFPRKHGA